MNLNCRIRCFSRLHIPALIVASILGFVSSALILMDTSHIFCVDMFPSVLIKPSMFHLTIVNLLPVIMTVFFLFIFPALCYPLLFLYSFFRGYCGLFTCFLFGDSAWLIRKFLLFSSGLTSLYIWLLIFWYQKGRVTGVRRICCLSILAVFLITVIDFFVISPFLSDLIIYF